MKNTNLRTTSMLHALHTWLIGFSIWVVFFSTAVLAQQEVEVVLAEDRQMEPFNECKKNNCLLFKTS
jgi:hypothetical protein